jgi:hypothetical protein
VGLPGEVVGESGALLTQPLRHPGLRQPWAVWKDLAVKVRMAVYWMAMEAKARRRTAFQEHCMAGHLHGAAPRLQLCRHSWPAAPHKQETAEDPGKHLLLPRAHTHPSRPKQLLL